jgi:lipoprotein-anchoring transpeptidase ErfK/SrfK
MRRPARPGPTLGLVLLALVAVGCRSGPTVHDIAGPPTTEAAAPAPEPAVTVPPAPAPAADPVNIVATANHPKIAVYPAAGAPDPVLTMASPTETGAPLVFLVEDQQPGWLEVHLPVRPNGSMGWVKAGDVDLTQNDYRIEVQLSAFRITVWKGPTVVLSDAVGVGAGATPTPGGRYYIKELLQPPDPNGPYGAFAYGLSGFSEVLTSFNGGSGVLGIHGTNDPTSIGHEVSYGCIRMANTSIAALARVLPLGVPVEIKA